MGYLILISSIILILATSTPADCAEQRVYVSLVYVPPGSFIMGDGAASCGWQQHEATLTRGFYLGQHEVRNQEYVDALQWAYDNGYVTATSYIVRDNLDGSTQRLPDLNHVCSEIQIDPEGGGTFYLPASPSPAAQSAYPHGYDPSNHPVKMVTWFGTVRFCDWLSLQYGRSRAYEHSGDWACSGGDPYGSEDFRLPTDAEWEHAAQFPVKDFSPGGMSPRIAAGRTSIASPPASVSVGLPRWGVILKAKAIWVSRTWPETLTNGAMTGGCVIWERIRWKTQLDQKAAPTAFVCFAAANGVGPPSPTCVAPTDSTMRLVPPKPVSPTSASV